MHRNSLFPIPQIRLVKEYFYPLEERKLTPAMLTQSIDKIIVPYKSGVPVFSDRPYVDEIGHKALDGGYVVRIPRHLDYSVFLKIEKPVIIYRMLSPKNDNNVFKDWENTDLKSRVVGYSCSHTQIVKKQYEPGDYHLPAGGPESSSPIIVKESNKNTLNNDFPIKLLNRRVLPHDHSISPEELKKQIEIQESHNY